MESSFEGGASNMGAPVSGGMTGGMGATDQGFEGGTVFESPVEGGDVFDQEVVFEEVETEGVFTDDSRQIMDIQGTAHDKLVTLAGMDKEEDPEEAEITDQKPDTRPEPRIFNNPEFVKTPEMSPEQQIMALQAEAIKILAQALRESKGQVDQKELEELIKKLKKLLEESQNTDKSKDKKESKTGMVTGTTLSLLGLMLVLSEKAINEVEEEASKN